MLRLYCPGLLRPEMFPGIGALPEPATGSHVVFIGVTVAAAASSTELTLIMMAGRTGYLLSRGCCRRCGPEAGGNRLSN